MDPATAVASSQEQEKQVETAAEAGDDFTAFAASDTDDHDKEDASSSTFHPHRITITTFRRLLSCYPTTVEQVCRRKMMVKMQPKPEKGSKAKAQKKAGSASANARGAALIQKSDFNPSEELYIKTETEKFIELDHWRYETCPKVIAERKADPEKAASDSNGYLTKDELVSVMDWKT